MPLNISKISSSSGFLPAEIPNGELSDWYIFLLLNSSKENKERELVPLEIALSVTASPVTSESVTDIYKSEESDKG